MKYMVHFEVTPEAGTKIEGLPGGPGPVVKRIMDRFKPEATYFAMSRRACWWAIDLDTPGDVGELMIALTDLVGGYPEFIPVVPGADFGGIIEKALPAAKKLVSG